MNDIFNTDVPLKTETPAFAKHVLPAVPSSEVYNEDCIEVMKRYEDNYFDIAIVDPPYGIDINSSGTHFKEKYEIKDWDKATPNDEYFNELKRVSKNQIIWGGNYFLDRLGNCKCFIIWDKKIAEDMSFAMCEMAWTSFKNGAKIYNKTATQLNRIHPTQKPIGLYDWLIDRYAEKGQIILDTHLGSGSSRISANKAGLSFVGCEIDKDYFNAQEKRYKEFISQTRLF
jgi:site-specific DNA-methyltransferase (adenine-specific)